MVLWTIGLFVLLRVAPRTGCASCPGVVGARL